MSKAPAKTSSIVRAVIRSHRWGGNGSFYTHEFRKGSKAGDAHFRNHMRTETFDEREARRARIDLSVYGSIREAVLARYRRDLEEQS